MNRNVAIIGAGVSGLTCGVVLAERGYRTAILAKETGQQTTSGAAAALWFPYDAEPAEKVIPWALRTFDVLGDLARIPGSGVSIIELRQFSRTGEIQIPDWAIPLGAQAVTHNSLSVMSSKVERSLAGNFLGFKSGYAITVPLMDTTIYLNYIANRFVVAGGSIAADVHFEKSRSYRESKLFPARLFVMTHRSCTRSPARMIASSAGQTTSAAISPSIPQQQIELSPNAAAC